MASQLVGTERREFWVLSLALFLVFCGFSTFFQFPLFIKAVGGSEREIGLIMGLSVGVSTLLLPWVASLVDQLNRKRLMLGGGALLAVSSGACLFLRAPDLWMGALMTLRGLGFSVFLVANGAYVASILPPGERSRWFSIYFAFWSLSSAVGPGIGEVVILQWGFRAFFLITLAILMAGLALTLFISSRPPLAPAPLGNPATAMLRFFVELLRPRFRYLFLALLAMSGAFSTVLTFTATFLRGLNLSSGLFFAAYAVVSVGSRVGAGGLSDRFGRTVVVVPTLLVLVAGLALYSVTEGMVTMVASAAIIGLGWGLCNPTVSAQMLDRAPPQLQGIAVGGYQFAFQLGMLVCTPVFGLIAESRGYPLMWRFSAGLVVAATLIYLIGAFRGRSGGLSRVP